MHREGLHTCGRGWGGSRAGNPGGPRGRHGSDIDRGRPRACRGAPGGPGQGRGRDSACRGALGGPGQGRRSCEACPGALRGPGQDCSDNRSTGHTCRGALGRRFSVIQVAHDYSSQQSGIFKFADDQSNDPNENGIFRLVITPVSDRNYRVKLRNGFFFFFWRYRLHQWHTITKTVFVEVSPAPMAYNVLVGH